MWQVTREMLVLYMHNMENIRARDTFIHYLDNSNFYGKTDGNAHRCKQIIEASVSLLKAIPLEETRRVRDRERGSRLNKNDLI